MHLGRRVRRDWRPYGLLAGKQEITSRTPRLSLLMRDKLTQLQVVIPLDILAS